MVRTLKIVPMSMLILLVMAAIVLTFVTPNTTKDTRHIKAPTIRTTFKKNICEGEELYYSFRMGTLLILCGLSNSDEWGGLVWRVSENNGERSLDNPYEITVFAANRVYWNTVITRDGYTPIVLVPSLKRFIRGSYQ